MAKFSNRRYTRGKSILSLATQLGVNTDSEENMIKSSEHIPFTAQTRMSGLDTLDGTKVRKGATDTIKKNV